MKAKQFYTTPSTDIIVLSIEKSCLNTVSQTTDALGNATTEDGTDYNNGELVLW